jgi:hypothetical protein
MSFTDGEWWIWMSVCVVVLVWCGLVLVVGVVKYEGLIFSEWMVWCLVLAGLTKTGGRTGELSVPPGFPLVRYRW